MHEPETGPRPGPLPGDAIRALTRQAARPHPARRTKKRTMTIVRMIARRRSRHAAAACMRRPFETGHSSAPLMTQ